MNSQRSSICNAIVEIAAKRSKYLHKKYNWYDIHLEEETTVSQFPNKR